jgi:RNA polymerase subunit RPABC4/transcription elongation factor Spt4
VIKHCPNCGSKDVEERIDEWSIDRELPLGEQIVETYQWCNSCSAVVDRDD